VNLFYKISFSNARITTVPQQKENEMKSDVQTLNAVYVELKNEYVKRQNEFNEMTIKKQAEERAAKIEYANGVLKECSEHVGKGEITVLVPEGIVEILEEAGVRVKFDFSNGDKEQIVICWDVVLMEDAKDFQPEDLEEMC
jgi:outer membrane murein-binding lipoprotein Lpp